MNSNCATHTQGMNVKTAGQGFTAQADVPQIPTMLQAISEEFISMAANFSKRESNVPLW